MARIPTVASTLDGLRKRIDDKGRVIDPKLARRIICRTGGTADEKAYVVLRAPASEKDLAKLDAICREQFDEPLPAPLAQLYRQTDGLWALSIPKDERWRGAARDVSYEGAIRPVKQVIAALEDVLVEEETPDGETLGYGLNVLAFADVPDQGWMALDPWRPSRTGQLPVVMYDFEEVDPTDLENISASCRRVAPSFEHWLAKYIDTGFSLFLEAMEEYGEPPVPSSVDVEMEEEELEEEELEEPPRPFSGVVHDGSVIFVSERMVLCKVEGLPFNPKLDRGADVRKGDVVRIGIEEERVRFLERTRADGGVDRWDAG